jgi:two-component system cell cycle sensor histidine kinase PleC
MMDRDALVVEASLPVEALSRRIATHGAARLDGGFIVVEDGRYLGVGSGVDALRLVADQAREHAQALKAARDAAEAASRAKSTFLANVSHELRTPLNAIIGFSELMGRALHGPLPERYSEYVWDIHASGQMLLELINDLLDLSRAEAGRLELREEELELAGVIEKCVRMLERRAAAMAHRLEVRLDPPDLAIRADRRMISQVLLNLLGNAIKFTPRNGYIAVSAALLPDGSAALGVTDTGIGIDRADIARVLEPFTQLDHDHNRRYEGTGLGLPLAKHLVELHGGTLAIDSDVDVGTRVTAFLPAERVLAPASPCRAVGD